MLNYEVETEHKAFPLNVKERGRRAGVDAVLVLEQACDAHQECSAHVLDRLELVGPFATARLTRITGSLTNK